MLPLPLHQHISVIVGSLVFLAFVIFNIRKNKLSKEVATIWIVIGAGLVLIAVFPQIISITRDLLGIDAMIHTVDIIMIFVLFILSFILYIRYSKLEQQVKQLSYELSLLKKDDKVE